MQLDSALSAGDQTTGSTTHPAAPLGVPILTEGFEGTWLPTGWTQVITDTGSGPGSGYLPTWQKCDYDFHSGAYSAGLWWDYYHQDEWLISPQVSLVGSTTGNYYITFWTYGWEGSTYGDHYYVKISTDGGTTWTTLFDLSTLTGNAWNYFDYPYTINLNAYAGQNVKLAFNAWDTGGGLWYIWLVDDVEIGYFDVPDNDVGVTDITAPVTGEASGTITPQATVKNFGAADQTDVPVQFTLKKYATPTTYFSDGFETYALGTYDFPAGWTNTTINTAPYGGWYMYQSAVTYSATVYPRIQEASSNGLAQDASLISPVIDCSALAAVNVQFTKYFYASTTGDATFTVYGSADGGATWPYTLVTYSATSSTSENIAITSWAAGNANVRLKFNFASPADATLSSYLYFDNLWVGNPTGNWGPYGNNPPIGWTIERKDTTTWDANHWYYYASSSYDQYIGSARVYPTSPYPELNENLTSPTFSCVGMTAVYLWFNDYFYTYTTYLAEGYVQLSTDGGTTWQDIDAYKITPPGSYCYSYWYEWPSGYDITSLAAGQANVKIRFHFTKPVSTTYGYWYVDNVRVGDGQGHYKLVETFDTGICKYYTGFKEYQHEVWGGKWMWRYVSVPYPSGNYWRALSSGTTPTCTPHGGSLMANYYGNIYQGQQARLYTIPLNVASANDLKLSFWMFHDTTYVGAGNIKVQASHDGHTWTTLATFNRNDGTNGWYQHIVNLVGYEDDTALQIGFVGTSDYVAYMNIDDVQVYDPGLMTIYTNTQHVAIDAGETVTVTFNPYTNPDWHTVQNMNILYDMFAETTLGTDTVPGNNLRLESCSLHYPYFHDIQVLSIDSPNANGPGQTQHVKATIKNIGQYQERNFFVPVQIGAKVYTTNGFFNNFESDNGGFTVTGGLWTWGVPSGATPYSGTKCWATQPSPYPASQNAYLTTGSITIPVGGDLTYYQNYYTENSYDGYNVKISTNGGTTWTLINPVGGYTGTANSANPLYPEPIFCGTHNTWAQAVFDLAAYEGMTVKFQFHFGCDSSVQYAGVFIDDMLVGNLIITIVPEYDESAAVASWIQPGDSVQLTYPDWTPDNLAIGDSGDIEYGIQATALNTPDDNTANNVALSTITLSYWHDVGIKKITSPAKGNRDLIFHQRPFLSTESWTFRTSASTYLCQDNFWTLTAPIGNIEFWGLCLVYSGGWTAGNQNTMPFTVKFYDDNAGVPGTEVASFPLAASTPVQFGSSGAYSGFTAYKWTYDLPSSVALTDGWMSIQSGTAPDNAWLLWAGSPEGDLDMWQQGSTAPHIAGDCAFNLSGTAGGVPSIQLYLAPGSQNIGNIVTNLGTFVETGLTCYAEIWDYSSNENGTLVWSNSVDSINLNPLGAEQTLAFGSYNFQNEGVYALKFNFPLTTDDVTGNNEKTLGIGIDKTAPTSTATISPATPDGLNGWYKSDVTITLASTDPKVNGVSSGVAKIEYQVDGGSWQTYTAPFKVTTDNAAHVVKYKATDKVGNVEAEKTVPSFKIDKTVPLIAMNYTWEKVGAVYNIIVTATCSDAMSGMAKVEFYFNGELQQTVTGAGPDFVWTYQYTPLQNVVIKGIAYDNCGLNAFAELVNPTSTAANQQSAQSHTTILAK